jgi:hypothetical protein
VSARVSRGTLWPPRAVRRERAGVRVILERRSTLDAPKSPSS